MKTLKITLLVSIFLCMSSNLLSQASPFQFGIKAGVNISSAFVDDASSTKFKYGYHIGLTVDYQLPKNFLLQSGLFFSMKGAKIENLNTTGYIGGTPSFSHTFNASYIELPIRGAYRLQLSEKATIIIGVGPYLGYGIGGKTKEKLNNGMWSGGENEHKWNTFGNGIFDEGLDHLRGESLNRFDFGASTNIDFEYKKYVLGIGYNTSIINIAKTRTYYDDMKYRNSDIKISLGYKF